VNAVLQNNDFQTVITENKQMKVDRYNK